MNQENFEYTVKKVSAINARLRAKSFTAEDIDMFWAKIFRLMPIIALRGIDHVEVCTGCGRLNIEEPIKEPALACCPDSHYKPINT